MLRKKVPDPLRIDTLRLPNSGKIVWGTDVGLARISAGNLKLTNGDDPSGYGSIQGNYGTFWAAISTDSIFDANGVGSITIGSAVADSLGYPSVVIQSRQTFSAGGSKIVSFKNNATEKAYIDKDGCFTSNATNYAFLGTNGDANIRSVNIAGASSNYSFSTFNADSVGLLGNIANGGTAIGVKIGNKSSLSTSGAKIVSFYNDAGTTEKCYISKDGAVVPAADAAAAAAGVDLGAAGKRWDRVYAYGLYDAGSRARFINNTNGAESSNIYNSGHDSHNASSIGHIFGVPMSFTTAGSKLASFQNNSVEKLAINKDGGLVVNKTINVSPGTSATANTPAGKHCISGGNATYTITNSLVTTSSIILVTLASNPGGTTVLYTVPGSGSFTVNFTSTPGGSVEFDWFVLN